MRKTQSAPGCGGAPLGSAAFVGGGFGNVAASANDGVLEGYFNEACDNYSSVGGGEANVISTATDVAYYSFIGAGYYNTITGSAEYGFVGGGDTNTVTGSAAAIVGGYSNQNAGTKALAGGGESNTVTASGTDAVLGGGSNNTVSAEYGVIAGGLHNSVSGEGAYIAAGGYNTASGEGSLVDGGFENTAAGTFATIPGGYANSAAGTYSFAAGVHASAVQNGTFVWSDGSNGDTTLASTAAYQFLARASGGFTLWTNAAATVGAKLAPGSGTWESASDRNLKTDVVRIDDAAVLDKVAQLPIDRWSYKSERGVRHVGPMAQDFYAAFGVGEDDKHIASIDEDGVALAAIKALHAENATLFVENASLRAKLAATAKTQSAQIAALRASDSQRERRLERLAAIVEALRER